VAWFAGSATMGLLYDKSIPALVIFSVSLQLLALPVLAMANKKEEPGTPTFNRIDNQDR